MLDVSPLETGGRFRLAAGSRVEVVVSMRALSDSALATLRSTLARLIPEEKEFAGALSAGTENFLLGLWEKEASVEFPSVVTGLEEMERLATARFPGKTFPLLTPFEQDELLRDLEKKPSDASAPDMSLFLSRLVDWTHEGFYANPANGGNRNAVSWRAIGYDPRSPLPDGTAGNAQPFE